MRLHVTRLALLISTITVFLAGSALSAEPGLVGYWKLQGDCLDHSGHGHHGTNHGVDLATSGLNGQSSFIEVPSSPARSFGTADFLFSAWVHTEKELTDVLGDLVTKFDAARRKAGRRSGPGARPGPSLRLT